MNLRELINVVENEETRVMLHNVVSTSEAFPGQRSLVDGEIRSLLEANRTNTLSTREYVQLADIIDEIIALYVIDKYFYSCNTTNT